MKKLSTLVMISLIVLSPLAFAAKGGEKGASEAALENASDQAIFTRAGDWFATLGKKGEAKKAVLAKRRAKRAQKRADKEAAKAEKQVEKEAKKAEKETSEAMDKAKAKAEKAEKEAIKKAKK